jgi:hypothetical protein
VFISLLLIHGGRAAEFKTEKNLIDTVLSLTIWINFRGPGFWKPEINNQKMGM